MNKNIFRAYDIRGHAQLDLDDETVTKIVYFFSRSDERRRRQRPRFRRAAEPPDHHETAGKSGFPGSVAST